VIAVARNITITLDDKVLRAARLAAARLGISVSALLREQLIALAEQDERYETAKRAALEWMERGASLGVRRRPTRDELHDRDALR
jgi:hypothetical protein